MTTVKAFTVDRSIETMTGEAIVLYDVKGMLEMLSSGKYSDFSITCNDMTFKVHRNIICARSSYFRKMLDGDFKEAKEDTVDMSDIEPELLARALMFVYCGSYTTDTLMKDFSTKEQLGMVNDAYGGDETKSKRILHAHMYTLGDRLCDKSLKEHARRKFAEVFLCRLQSHNMYCCRTGDCELTNDDVAIITYIYENTIKSDRGLRDMVVYDIGLLMRDHKCKCFDVLEKLIDGLPELSADLVKRPMLAAHQTRTCTECHETFSLFRLRCSCKTWLDLCKSDCTEGIYAEMECWSCFRKGSLVKRNGGSWPE